MRLEVLSEGWTPPGLVMREDKIGELRSSLGSGVVLVVGPSGVGKTTLVKLALDGYVYVDCGVKRTYASIVREIAGQFGLKGRLGIAVEEILGRGGTTYVLDDYTLSKRSRRLAELVGKLAEKNAVVLVIHPSIKAELAGLAETTIEMPPYSDRELYAILEDRVIQGELPVSEEALEAISRRVGYPKGSGSARISISVLRKALKLSTLRGDSEVLPRHVEAAFRLLSL